MAIDKQKLFTTINELVGEELKVVSFKWLARQFSIPANAAKRILAEFLEKNQGRVSATYLISGWTKGSDSEHSIQLVDSGSLIERRKALDPITSLHVYSVQPTQPKDASELWNTDNLQTLEFFTSLVKGGSDNCLADNRWSAVQCQQAKHDPTLSTAKALGARTAAEPPPPEPAPANGVVAAIKKAAAGSAAGKGSEAGKDKGSAPAAPSGAAKPAAAPTGASAPGANQGRASAPAKAAPAGGKKGAALSAMWSKAPPKKAKGSAAAAPAAASGKAASAKAAEERVETKQKSTAAVDAEAALRLNDQGESSSDSEEEHMPIQRSNAGRRARVLHDDAEDSDQDSPVQPASKRPCSGNAAAVGARRNAAVLNESDDDSDWEAPKKCAGRGGWTGKDTGAKAKDGGSTAAAADSDDEEAPSQKKKGAKPATEKKAGTKATAAKRPSPGTIKVHGDATGGPKRRKVLRTTYNDKGDEITEMVYEDEPAAEADQPAPKEKEEDAPAAAAAAAKLEAAEPAAAKAARASSQSQGSAGAPAKKEPAKAAAKKGGAKVLPGQRGIKSFFAKK